jgi:hypothetical protein
MAWITGLVATVGALTGVCSKLFFALSFWSGLISIEVTSCWNFKCYVSSIMFVIIIILSIGEHGFFRIVRGGNYNPGTAYWAVPDIPNF